MPHISFLHRCRLIVCLVLIALPVAARLAEADERPNVLMCISDDQSWLHTSFAGDKVVETPTFDRVAREGIYFRNAFCSAPSCTPSRGAVLTGQDFWRLEDGANLFGTLPNKFDVYPDLLQQAGYCIGYMKKGWAPGNFQAAGWKRNPAGPKFKNFAEFMKTVNKDQPFCFWFGSSDPHRPYVKGSGLKSGKKLTDVALPEFFPDVPQVRSDILDYYVEIERFDSQVGKMLALLESQGKLENTIVIVTSDNGMPFPRCKTNLYDYGTHMPLAIRWPKGVKANRVLDDFVNLIDFAPTLLEAAGLKVPTEMTGRSLLPLLTSDKSGQIDPQRDFVVVGRERHGWNRDPNVGYPCRAIRTKDYLYIHNYRPQRRPGFDCDGGPTRKFLWDNREQSKIRPFYLLWFEQRPAEELYDVHRDPDQIKNVAQRADLAKVKADLQAKLNDYLRRNGDPRVMAESAPFDDYRYFGGPTSNMHLYRKFYQIPDPKK